MQALSEEGCVQSQAGLWDPGQIGLQSTFQAQPGNTVKPCLILKMCPISVFLRSLKLVFGILKSNLCVCFFPFHWMLWLFSFQIVAAHLEECACLFQFSLTMYLSDLSLLKDLPVWQYFQSLWSVFLKPWTQMRGLASRNPVSHTSTTFSF